jgi:hypothetical protein
MNDEQMEVNVVGEHANSNGHLKDGTQLQHLDDNKSDNTMSSPKDSYNYENSSDEKHKDNSTSFISVSDDNPLKEETMYEDDDEEAELLKNALKGKTPTAKSCDSVIKPLVIQWYDNNSILSLSHLEEVLFHKIKLLSKHLIQHLTIDP